MSRPSYSVYHYDTLAGTVGNLIAAGQPITTADELACRYARRAARHHRTSWKRVTDGDNCRFLVRGQRQGYIVIKQPEATDED